MAGKEPSSQLTIIQGQGLRRLVRQCARAFAAVVGLILLLTVVHVLHIFWEQWHWRPCDDSRFRIEGFAYSPEGAVVSLYAPGGVAEVWRQGPAPGERLALLKLWRPEHHRVPSRVASGNGGRVKVLVDYQFHPGDELLLGIRSGDGLWVTSSEYLPDEPELSSADWRRLIAMSQPTDAH